MKDLSDHRALLSLLAAWVHDSSDLSTVGEALRLLYVQDMLPDDVRAAWSSLHLLPFRELFPESTALTLRGALEQLDISFKDDRDSFIFWSRIVFDAPTLDELAEQLGITRERVRQLQSRADSTVREALQTVGLSALRWRIWRFHQRVGRAIPLDALWYRDAVAELTKRAPENWSSKLEQLALWIGGYRRDSLGWAFSCELIDPDYVVKPATHPHGRVDLPAVYRKLEEEGVVRPAVEQWLSRFAPVKEISGYSYLWEGSLADKAAVVLRAVGTPMTIDEIVDQIGEGHDPRGARARLYGDPRFVRAGLKHFGLRGWEVDEYTGIVDEIAEELERRGGAAPIKDVAHAVAATHGVSAGSVIGMTGAPRFVVEEGIVRLRSESEAYQVDRTAVDERGCFLLNEDLCLWRTVVDGQLLRGSGRSIPTGLGAWLGVLPGRRLDIQFRDGRVVQVTWPDRSIIGPSIGSLRTLATGLGACEGDSLLIRFDRRHGTADISVVSADTLDRGSAEERLRGLTGLDPLPPDLEARVAYAVGARAGNEIRERLRKRGEETLIDLLPSATEPTELDDALEQLRGLL
jgi:hypothetical protein